MCTSKLAETAVLSVESLTVKRNGKSVLLDVSLTLEPGDTLAIVGESGAGKSTLIAAILGLVRYSASQLTWEDKPVRHCRPALVMQEPRSAFNPRMALRDSVIEPLRAQGLPINTEHLAALCKGLEIKRELLDRRPEEVSIGQAQRVGIMRALIASPPLVLFDEPLSALDAVTQKHTAQLIARLQAQIGFAALIVTHDLGYAAAYADQIAVLRCGKIDEWTTAQSFIESPQTPYGRQLRDAAFSLGALERAV